MKNLLLAIILVAMLGCDNSTEPKQDPIPDPPKPNTAMSYFKNDTAIYETTHYYESTLNYTYDTLYYSTIEYLDIKAVRIYTAYPHKSIYDLYVYQFLIEDDTLKLSEADYNNGKFNYLAFTTSFKTDTLTFTFDKSKSIYLPPHPEYIKIAKNKGIIEIYYKHPYSYAGDDYEVMKRIN